MSTNKQPVISSWKSFRLRYKFQRNYSNHCVGDVMHMNRNHWAVTYFILFNFLISLQEEKLRNTTGKDIFMFFYSLDEKWRTFVMFGFFRLTSQWSVGWYLVPVDLLLVRGEFSLRFRWSRLIKMAKLWLASAILLCVAVTVLKSEKLNNRESGTCNKPLITRQISELFHGSHRVAKLGGLSLVFNWRWLKNDLKQ